MEWNIGNVDVIRAITVFTAIVGAVFAIGKIIRALWTLMRRISHALDLIIGVPSIGETPARPGIIARVAKIEAETQPNHGTSMRDVIDTIKTSIAKIELVVARLEHSLSQHINDHQHNHRVTSAYDDVDPKMDN